MGVGWSPERSTNPEVSKGWAPCPAHQLAGRAVLIGFIQVALAIVGLHQLPQLPIQGYVGHVVRGEDQQVRRLLTLADLLLGESKPCETVACPCQAHASPLTLYTVPATCLASSRPISIN